MTTTRLFQILLLASSTACSTMAPDLSDRERVSIAAEVETATREFEAAERARDVQTLLAFLAPDFYMYQDGLRIGHDAIAAQIRSTMPTLQRFETAFENIEVRVLGRNGAMVSLTFRDAVTDAGGATTRQSGVTTFVWERRGEVWLLSYAHAEHYPDSIPQESGP